MMIPVLVVSFACSDDRAGDCGIAAGAGRRSGARGPAPGRERRGEEDAHRVEPRIQAHCLRGTVSINAFEFFIT